MSYVYSSWLQKERLVAFEVQCATGRPLENIIDEWRQTPVCPTYNETEHEALLFAAYRVALTKEQFHILEHIFAQLVLGER